MSELTPKQPETNLPSGFISAEQLHQPLTLDETVLPWLKEPTQVSVARCELEGGKGFYLASAIGTNRRLVDAAEAMNNHQKRITDNLFYSHIPGYIESGFANNVETMPNQATSFAIHVMRNRGGQRVYFGMPRLSLDKKSEPVPVVLRLGVCDKKEQDDVMKVLSNESKRSQSRKRAK